MSAGAKLVALAVVLAWLLASYAFAGPRVEWGIGSAGPSAAELARCPDADCWTVTLRPTLISVGSSRTSLALDAGGFAVVVLVEEGNGAAPDTFTVVPPPGYAAEPASVTVRDGEAGVVTLRPVPMG